MENSKKKLIIVFSIIAVFVVALVGALVAFSFGGEQNISIKANDGEEIGTASWNGFSTAVTATDEKYTEYVMVAVNHAIEIFVNENDLSEAQAEKHLFKNVTEIKTNLDKATFDEIAQGYEKQKLESGTNCYIATTDLHGKLTAVFSNGAEALGSMSKTYAGSTIKPISVYAPAIESGKANWSSVFIDSPVTKIREDNGEMSDWPVNSNNQYTQEDMLLTDALANSTNTIAVKLLQALGVQNAIDVLENDYGINVDYEKTKIEGTDETEVLGNIALGYLYNGVSAIDMAGYYQPFANGGTYCKPTAVDELLKNGEVVYKSQYEEKRVFSLETSVIMNEMLQLVVKYGTGEEARIKGIDVGGKTGTTSGNADNWFAGFTPDFTCAVYHSFSSEGNQCPEIFKNAFENSELKNQEYPESNKIVREFYCEKSGLLRGNNCVFSSRGYYTVGQRLARCDKCQ